jgi:hypothetical protein
METSTQIKDRLFRECDAMVLYIAARGIEKEMPEATMLDHLDKSSVERSSVPLAELLPLHQSLARIVSPAFPETIEKLYEYQKRDKFYTGLAPLNLILWLIIATIGLILAFGIGLSTLSEGKLPKSYYDARTSIYGVGKPTATVSTKPDTDLEFPYFLPVIEYLNGKCRFSVDELTTANEFGDNPQDSSKAKFDSQLRTHFENCQSLRHPILLRIFLFFGALGMLGAAYSSIYDSFSYIREGRYDLRLASTYYVRILLGGFSGILLAEPLSGFLDGGVISSALLAFLGGFSAQLVYDLLTKLVDSVANLFRADRRKEQQIILAQAEFNARGIILEDDATKRHSLAAMLAEAQNEPNVTRRAEMMQTAILSMLSGNYKSGNVALGAIAGASFLAEGRRVLALSEITSHLADLLPDLPPDIGPTSAAANSKLAQALTAFSTLGTSDSQTQAKTARTAALDTEIVSERLKKGLRNLGTAVKDDALRALAKISLAAGSTLDQGTIARWRYIAYGASSPDIRLLQGLDATTIGAGLTGNAGAELSPAEIIAAINAGEMEALANTGGFADMAELESAVAAWINATARRVLADELGSSAISTLDGMNLTGAQIIAALDNLSDNDIACGGLQTLELIGGASTKCKNPADVLKELLTLTDVELGWAGQ